MQHWIECDLLGQSEDRSRYSEDQVYRVRVFFLLHYLYQGQPVVVDRWILLVGLAAGKVKVIELLCTVAMDAVLASSLLGLWGSLPLAVLLVCCLLLDGRRGVLLGNPKG